MILNFGLESVKMQREIQVSEKNILSECVSRHSFNHRFQDDLLQSLDKGGANINRIRTVFFSVKMLLFTGKTLLFTVKTLFAGKKLSFTINILLLHLFFAFICCARRQGYLNSLEQYWHVRSSSFFLVL